MWSLRKLIERDTPLFYACPAILWQVLFFALPLVGIAAASVLVAQSSGGFALSLHHYASVCTMLHFKIIMRSLILATLTAITALLIAYPVAYYLAFYARRLEMLLLFGLILPSWTNLIVQAYSWYFLLDTTGFYSRIFQFLGIIAPHGSLSNCFGAIWVGMVYCFLPFMTFPIYVALEKMDKRLIEASLDLGANHWQTFCRVVFPLSRPGVYAGLLLVFIPAFGEFAIPILLGGARDEYWSMAIMETFVVRQDWASGFALAMLGLFSVGMLMIALYSTARLYRWMKTHA